MKQTPFFELHKELGAKMSPFAGFEMPIEYEGIIHEHLTVCNHVGVFDVSHMGEFNVVGKGALAYLQNLVSNDVSLLKPGQVQYSYLPNDQGGIVDDLLVYKQAEETYLLVVNASNIDKDWAWCVAHNDGQIALTNASDQTAQLAVQGPEAMKTLQKLTTVNLSEIPYYHFKYATLAGIDNVLISNTGYTGAGGFELYFPVDVALDIWRAVFEAGKTFGIKPIGLGARDTLRLEMGFCLYGNDIDDQTSPIEAGLGWVTKFNPEKHYPSKALFEQQFKKGVAKKRVGFTMIDKGFARHGYSITDETGRQIGEVTSGSISPVLKVGIGMGYVETGYDKPGSVIYIKIRDRLLKSEVVRMPFREFI
jgi:aminomethyltransferase